MTAPKRAVVVDANFPDLNFERAAAESAGASFETFSCTSPDETVAALAGADVALIQLAPVPPEAIAGMHPGGVIVRYGIGVDNVPLAACAEHGIRVCNVPDYGVDEVADHACAMLLALLRRLPQLDAQVRAGEWDSNAVCGQLPSLAGIELGLFGLGRIGSAVARRAAAFGMKCSACDPHVSQAPPGVELVAADALLERSDAITLHMPTTDETRGMINAALLAKIKPTAVLVNCSRGELVDEQALADALAAGSLAAAALDVTVIEPLPADSALRSAPNLLLSPHAAWCTLQARTRLQQLAAEEAGRALRGEQLRCEIKPA